jgi:two-component system, OmpR family, copper resistance phosphate regulon response regulator CusR
MPSARASGPPQVLLIEDDPKVAEALCSGLAGEGFFVAHERLGRAGLARARSGAFDLIVLDLLLPDADGLDILIALRTQCIRSRVLILTARNTVHDRVAGLNAGADDYVVKPFAFTELVARIHALLRRASAQQTRLRVADLEVDLVTRDVRHAERRIELTTQEFELLVYLMQRRGEVVSRGTIARAVYQQERSTTIDNIIDVHVAQVRKKLDDAGGRPVLEIVLGVGFSVSDQVV